MDHPRPGCDEGLPSSRGAGAPWPVHGPLGTRSKLGCYTEVVFRGAPDQAKDRPDGLMVLETGGGRTWRCLVEAKIGKAEIEAEQVERYLTIARHHKVEDRKSTRLNSSH